MKARQISAGTVGRKTSKLRGGCGRLTAWPRVAAVPFLGGTSCRKVRRKASLVMQVGQFAYTPASARCRHLRGLAEANLRGPGDAAVLPLLRHHRPQWAAPGTSGCRIPSGGHRINRTFTVRPLQRGASAERSPGPGTKQRKIRQASENGQPEPEVVNSSAILPFPFLLIFSFFFLFLRHQREPDRRHRRKWPSRCSARIWIRLDGSASDRGGCWARSPARGSAVQTPKRYATLQSNSNPQRWSHGG